MTLKPGDPAPDFKGLTTDGSETSLDRYRGRKLVLYFYPMDSTPGCTAQACALRDGYAEIRVRGAEILGVSTQGVQSHQRFTDKHRLPFPLLADTGGIVARAYGVMGGRGPLAILKTMAGMADRVTFIIDEAGTIAHVMRRPRVSRHAGEVLALL